MSARSVRAALRSAHTSSGMSSTMAMGSTSYFFASSISCRRLSCCTLVASTTVRRPAASRLPAM